jgi:hypothetical protein
VAVEGAAHAGNLAVLHSNTLALAPGSPSWHGHADLGEYRNQGCERPLLARKADIRKLPMSGKCRYCCKSRKSDDAENLAKIDSELSLRLQPSLARYEGRWSFLRETMWSLTSPRAKRISGPKKFRSSPKKALF